MLFTRRFRFASCQALAVAVLTVCAIIAGRAMWAQQSGLGVASSGNGTHSIARKAHVEGVRNFGEVKPNLLRGAQPTEKGFEQLAKMGVEIVVDLRDDREQERAEVTHLGMEYVPIPWQCYHPRDVSIAEFLALVRNNPEKKIFVHCRLGTDRTGMMIAAYRMTQQGWTAAEARKEMEAFGFSFAHETMCPGLAAYEGNFPHEFLASPVFQGLRSAQTAEPHPQQ